MEEGTNVGKVWHVAMATPDAQSIRRVYAAGPNEIWHSQDGGNTWRKDRGPIPPSEPCCGNAFGVVGDFPSEGFQRSSARILAVEPGRPDHVFLAVPSIMNGPAYYFSGVPDGTPCDPRDPPGTGPGCGGGTLWLGDYSAFSQGQSARWDRLLGPPAYQGGNSTPSGRVYVVTQPLGGTIEPPPYLLFFGDASHVHVSFGRPQLSPGRLTSNSWHRLDGRDASHSTVGNILFVHVDPHALVVSKDFKVGLKSAEGVSYPYDQHSVLDLAKPIGGTIWMANDGGVYRSFDGGRTWKLGDKLATLQPQFPFAGAVVAGKPPALYFGGPDNLNFFTLDGGIHWSTPVTGGVRCGDCGAWFSDPAQPNRVVEFDGPPTLSLYINEAGGYANAGNGTQRHEIPLPDTSGSGRALRGYRPLILTAKDEDPPGDTDFVLIQNPGGGVIGRVLRTMKLREISSTSDWNTTGGPKVVQQGPNFIAGMEKVDVVQVSGGHGSPIFYVGDPDTSKHLWRCASECTGGRSGWQRIVPADDGSAAVARRFFVNPYDPNEIYIIDESAIKRSINGGLHWAVDVSLNDAVTENGLYSYEVMKLSDNSNTVISAVIRDMVFVRNEAMRFAVGNAGVFLSGAGGHWHPLLSTSALPGHPAAAYFDPSWNGAETDRALYVAFDGRGILRLGSIPSPFTVIGLGGVAVGEYAAITGDTASNGEVTLGKSGRMTGDVAANAVSLREWARIEGNVSAAAINVGGNATITGTQSNQAALPIVGSLPPVQSAPGGEAVIVPKQGMRQLQPGSFLSIVAGESAEIHFTGGQYDVAEFRIGKGTRLIFAAASVINVATRLEVGEHVVLTGSGMLTPGDIRLNYAGSADAVFGKSAQGALALVAPNALIQLGEGGVYAGHIWGQRVRIGKGVQIKGDD